MSAKSDARADRRLRAVREAKIELERDLVALFDEFAKRTGLVVRTVEQGISWENSERPRVLSVIVRAELP